MRAPQREPNVGSQRRCDGTEKDMKKYGLRRAVQEILSYSLDVDGKQNSSESIRKSVVKKLKKAGQPRHKFIQITC